MKRMRFDPGFERRKIQRRDDALTVLKARAQHFCESVQQVLSSSDVTMEALSTCESLCRDLVLVAALGGLEGVESLKMAFQLVPKQFMAERSAYLKRIVSFVSKTEVSTTTLEKLGTLLANSTYSNHEVSSQAYVTSLRKLSETTGTAHITFIAPPVSQCIVPSCYGSLTSHHAPVSVMVYTQTNGPMPATKCSLKCNKCSTIYNYATYGKKTQEGEQYYKERRPLVEVTDVVYCERRLFDLYCSLSLHCWVSFSGFAEVLFEHTHHLTSATWAKTFKEQHNKAYPLELTRKHVSEMYFRGEVEEEVHERSSEFKLKSDSDFEAFMAHTEEERVVEHYAHQQSERCIKKGCGMAWAIDGNWKLRFPVCMFPVRATQPHMRGLNVPDVCPSQPSGNTAFCTEHFVLAQQRGYPCTVREFVRYCGALETADAATADDDQIEIVEKESAVLDKALDTMAVPCPGQGVAKAQGTEGFLSKYPAVLQDYSEPTDSTTSCRKDLGEKGGKIKHWSRGHVFIVRSCGHIDTWKPIYSSESCSQVFTIVLVWLMSVVERLPKEEWSKIVIAYDNMCHLDSLKVARKPLPIPPPYDAMWLSVKKVIDELHFKNHIDKACRESYDPSEFKKEHPGVTFMRAEQTFTWLSRFHKILCAMPKNHHMFYLHRLVKRRNAYMELCHALNRHPLLPKHNTKGKQVKPS